MENDKYNTSPTFSPKRGERSPSIPGLMIL